VANGPHGDMASHVVDREYDAVVTNAQLEQSVQPAAKRVKRYLV
jgi:hypothetical protein